MVKANKSLCNPDIMFVVPPLLRFMGEESTSYPLGLGCMVSCLKMNGYSTFIYDADGIGRKGLFDDLYDYIARKIQGLINRVIKGKGRNELKSLAWVGFACEVDDLNSLIWKEVRDVIHKVKPKIVGISSRVVDVQATLILSGIIKEVDPEIKVIVGGVSATTVGSKIIGNANVDYLVIGEGEVTIVELVRYLRSDIKASALSIPGVVYKDLLGGSHYSGPRDLIRDISSIPNPDRESLYSVNRRSALVNKYFLKDVISSRGCPYKCTFCCAHVAWGSRAVRYRSVIDFADEIDILNGKYGQKDFIFWDDMFTSDKQRVLHFCNEIIRRKLLIRWICLARVNSLSSEVLALMMKAGCVEIQVGIESGSDRVLSLIKKGISRSRIIECSSIIRRTGIRWHAFFIIGFPTETIEEIRQTLDLIYLIRPSSVDVSAFCPYPGTEMCDMLAMQSSLDDDYMRSDFWNPHKCYTGTMSDDEYKELVLRAFRYVDQYNSGIVCSFSEYERAKI